MLVLETHPCHGSEDDYGNEDYGKDTSQAYHRAGVGRGSNCLNHIIDGANQVHAHYDTDHDTDKSCYVNGRKPPVRLK